MTHSQQICNIIITLWLKYYKYFQNSYEPQIIKNSYLPVTPHALDLVIFNTVNYIFDYIVNANQCAIHLLNNTLNHIALSINLAEKCKFSVINHQFEIFTIMTK